MIFLPIDIALSSILLLFLIAVLAFLFNRYQKFLITRGIDKVIPVNAVIHGCPPTPVALLQGILKAIE